MVIHRALTPLESSSPEQGPFASSSPRAADGRRANSVFSPRPLTIRAHSPLPAAAPLLAATPPGPRHTRLLRLASCLAPVLTTGRMAIMRWVGYWTSGWPFGPLCGTALFSCPACSTLRPSSPRVSTWAKRPSFALLLVPRAAALRATVAAASRGRSAAPSLPTVVLPSPLSRPALRCEQSLCHTALPIVPGLLGVLV